MAKRGRTRAEKLLAAYENPQAVIPVNDARELEDVAPPEVPGALANKATYRISEVAAYYDVTERTIRLWIEHGHLKVAYTGPGMARVTRESLDLCRFRPRSSRFG